MAIQGKQRVQADYQKKVGFDEMKVLAFNPTKEELETLLNIPDMKEPSYLGTYQNPTDGKEYPKTTISVWLQGLTSQALLNARYSLIKKVRFDKNGLKKQFINDVGDTAWAIDENTLRANAVDMDLKEGTRNFYKQFVSRDFREAYMGEDKLFDFLQKFTNIDTRDQGVQITLDLSQLFKGNYSEIQELLESEYKTNTMCGCATVRVVPPVDPGAEPGSFKEYQSVYEEFLPGSYIRYFQANVTTRPDYVKKYIANLEGEYGSKDFYIIGPIRDYIPAENPAVKELLRVAAVQSGTIPATNNAAIGADGKPEDDLPF